MSLISQRDRKLTVDALNCYLKVKKALDCSEQEKMEINALINWINLEYYKHDN